MATAHNLILANPFNDSSSSEEDPAASVSSAPTSALRAQLHHLLPRHAIFRAQIHIHQIANIPLVSGEFGVKWKFKHVHTPPAAKQGGLLGIVKGKSAKGKGKEDDEQEEDGETGSLASVEPPSSQLLTADWRPLGTPSSTAFPSSSMSSRTTSSAASTYTTSSRSSSSSAPMQPSFVTASSATLQSSMSVSTANANTTPTSPPILGSTTAPRGVTPFLPLRDHNVTWDHTLDVLLRMDIERGTQTLLSSPLTLTVMQAGEVNVHAKGKATSNGHHKNPDTRLGLVHLDLAQYADRGEVGRRYLLRDSKTNATLKLTVCVTHASGPADFHAPPLPKGEISNGLSGILEENEVYRTRPRGLNLYGPYGDQEELEIDLLGVKGISRPGSAADEIYKHERTTSIPVPIFDPERLPHAYGPKTTETLIDAIFNPVNVVERRRESPFTVYVEPDTASTKPVRPLLNGAAPGAFNAMAGMKPRVPGAARARPMPSRSGSGISAGLGIMGLGMGLGVGMGVGVGVSGRASADSRRPSEDGNGKPGPGTRPSTGDRRQASQGSASIWSASTAVSGVSADVSVSGSTESGGARPGSSMGHERSGSFGDRSDSPAGKRSGMKGWFRKKMASRPGTPTLAY